MPGRFKLPITPIDRLTARFSARLRSLLREDTATPPRLAPHPLAKWQPILDFLHASRVTESRHVKIERLFNDEPRFFSLRLFSVLDPALTDGKRPRSAAYSRGVSHDFDEAVSKVIGEFLERYPLTLYRRKDFLRASPEALARAGRRHLNIFDLAGFADWQKELFPDRRFDARSTFFWTEGRELLSREKALIPAQLVFWNYNTLQEPEEPYLRQPITNGAAGHFTWEEAVVAGIYENIQRDSFLIHWLNSIAPPRIDPRTMEDDELRTLIKAVTNHRFEVVFLNTTLDLRVPSCACLLIDTSGVGPRLSVGGGCGPDLSRALLRSLTEALGVYHWLRERKNAFFVLPSTYRPFRDPIVDQAKRLLLWGAPEMFSRLAWFLTGPVQSLETAAGGFPASFRTPHEELRYLLEILRSRGRGYEVYVYTASNPLLEALGYHSVRVTIPALVPLYLFETGAPLGAARLREVPSLIGRSPSDEPNPWPHPFP